MNEEKRETNEMLKLSEDFEIMPYENVIDFQDSPRFQRLNLTSEQKMHISTLIPNLIAAAEINTLANAYVVKFPKGLPHTLTKLKQGGFGSMIQDSSGKFTGSASFYPVSMEAAALGLFNAMSVASGQYFLSQINHEMKKINRKLDDILEFLYGDKKAELIAEISFVQYAYENYNSIMSHDEQRIATIGSLQNAKKVAMKDIEFYICDLKNKTDHKSKDFGEFETQIEEARQIKESLELSQQLYLMSSIMEVYFAQNQDTEYLNQIEKNAFSYIDKCNNRVVNNFSSLSGMISMYKARPMEKIEKKRTDYINQIANITAFSNSENESPMKKAIRSALYSSTKMTECYLDRDGEVYIRA